MKSIITVSGPSASGKSTLASVLIKSNNVLEEVVSTTTRRPRANERNGLDYHFIEKNEFLKRKKQNKFIETSVVGNDFYGVEKTSIEKLFDDNKIPLVVCDPLGAYNMFRFGQEQSIPVCNVFVSVDQKVALNRILKRLTNANLNLEDKELVNKLIHSTAERLVLSATNERYWHIATQYDYRVKGLYSDSDSQKAVNSINTALKILSETGSSNYFNYPEPKSYISVSRYTNCELDLMTKEVEGDLFSCFLSNNFSCIDENYINSVIGAFDINNNMVM